MLSKYIIWNSKYENICQIYVALEESSDWMDLSLELKQNVGFVICDEIRHTQQI